MTESHNNLALESRRYRKRRSADQFIARLTHLTVPCIAAVVAIAFLAKVLWPPLIYLLGILPLWIVGAVAYLLLHRPLWAVSPWQADALTDLKSGSKGLFMAVQEKDERDWAPALRKERIRLEIGFPWRHTLMWLAGAVAVVAVLLLPDLRSRVGPAPAVTPIERMEDLLAVLHEEELADEQFVERVEEVLKELKEETFRSLKAEDWQALDSLRDDVKREALDSLQRLNEERKELAALHEALARPPTAESLSRLGADEATRQCMEAARSAGLDGKELSEFLEKCREGGFDFNAREEALLEALSGNLCLSQEELDRLKQCLGNMAKLGRLSDESMKALLGKCESGACSFSEEDVENLKSLLAAADSECDRKMACCAALLSEAGRGGVSRGPGPAALSLSNDDALDSASFENKTFQGNLSESTVPLGFSYAPPETTETDGSAMEDGFGPAVRFDPGNERITWHSRLLPRHNDVMKKYFQEER